MDGVDLTRWPPQSVDFAFPCLCQSGVDFACIRKEGLAFREAGLLRGCSLSSCPPLAHKGAVLSLSGDIYNIGSRTNRMSSADQCLSSFTSRGGQTSRQTHAIKWPISGFCSPLLRGADTRAMIQKEGKK